MKVTYFIGSLTGGGAERVICELASYMSKQGHDSTILIVSKTNYSYQIDPNVKIKTLDIKLKIANKKLKIMVKMLKLFLYLLKDNSDMYVVFLPKTIKALMFFRRIIKKPIVVSERNNPSSYDEKTQNEMIQLFSKADGIVFQTSVVEKYYREKIHILPKSIIIPNAITNDKIIPFDGKRNHKIVSVGRFNQQKNFHLLIKAFSKISSEFPDYHLVIFGEGSLKEEYLKLIDDLKLNNRVQFPGFKQNVLNHIKDASLFVLSSDYEGMPNALIEAMTLGLPCISTRCGGGGAEFLIENEVNGILVDVGDINEMASSMRRILLDEKLSNRLGKNASRVSQTLSKDNIYEKWKRFLESIYTNNNKRWGK